MGVGRYEVQILPSARKVVDRLPTAIRERVEAAIAALADQPRPRGSKKLKDADDTYRIRVGDYRVIYRIFDEALVIIIVKVGDRKDVYRS